MNCQTSNDYIMKYFDGEINDLEEAQFRQHLKTCPKCSEEFNCMSEIFGSLETAETIEPPEGFEASVMEKVNKVELARKERNSRMLVLLYNAATAVSILLLMIFVADLKQVSVFNAFEKIGQYFGSFTSAAAAVFGVVGDILRILTGVAGVILDVAVSIVKSYYYVFITLIGLLLAIQRLYAYVAAQDGRKTK
jgi:anti-sigma factor RsiW